MADPLIIKYPYAVNRRFYTSPAGCGWVYLNDRQPPHDERVGGPYSADRGEELAGLLNLGDVVEWGGRLGLNWTAGLKGDTK